MMQTAGKTAFVFAGGDGLGAVQVGMLRVLLAAGVKLDFVIGTSVGAMNAAYFAGAQNAEGVEKLADLAWHPAQRYIPAHSGPDIRSAQTTGKHCGFARLAESDRGQSAICAVGGVGHSRPRDRDFG
jgi:predicted acylesterase/phospholipase RssA